MNALAQAIQSRNLTGTPEEIAAAFAVTVWQQAGLKEQPSEGDCKEALAQLETRQWACAAIAVIQTALQNGCSIDEMKKAALAQ